MFIRLLLDEQWSIVQSAANNIDRGCTENSYWPTVSFISISGLLLHTIIIRAKRDLSSWNSTILSAAVTCTTFNLVFHVRSFVFFMVDQRLTSPDWTRSFTKQSNSLLPISLCSHKSLFTVSGITTLVTRLNRSVCASENGFVNFSLVAVNCATPFSSRAKTAVVRLWWRPWGLEDTPSHVLCLFS